jgi:formylglycine-generating enzyme
MVFMILSGPVFFSCQRKPPTQDVNSSLQPGQPAGQMVLIPAGQFEMGCADCKMDDALPVHVVALDSFWLDATPVTNAQYQKFVDDTGYRTVAERPLDPKEFPGANPNDLVPGSIVFTPPPGSVDLTDFRNWWRYVPGASWRHPEGPDSNLSGREDHPVVHIAYEDALQFATWAGKRLPTEAEYEYAARASYQGTKYPWGNDLKPNRTWVANIWQGEFPHKNSAEDGFEGTSPVKQFPANHFGLYDMGGNVWQWCSDWYRPDYYQFISQKGIVAENPVGPQTSLDPFEPGLKKRVQRGGSFLCSDQYCERYLVGSRGKGEINSASSNVGFRCAKSTTR